MSLVVEYQCWVYEIRFIFASKWPGLKEFFVSFEMEECTLVYLCTKGQLISKADWRAIDSPKKGTDEFVVFAFLLFTVNKSNSSIHFLGESTAGQSAFWFYLSFRQRFCYFHKKNPDFLNNFVFFLPLCNTLVMVMDIS